jgi:hypothetical protein
MKLLPSTFRGWVYFLAAVVVSHTSDDFWEISRLFAAGVRTPSSALRHAFAAVDRRTQKAAERLEGLNLELIRRAK